MALHRLTPRSIVPRFRPILKSPRLALLFSLLLAPILHAAEAGQRDIVNAIWVEVGSSVITYRDVTERTREDEEMLASTFVGPRSNLVARINALRDQTLEQLVVEKLILHEFKTLGYQLPDRIVEEQIEQDIKRKFGGNRLALTQTLQAQGTTFEAYRNRVEEMTIVQLMHEKFVPANPPVSPAKLEAYYREHMEEYKLGDQIKLRTIVIVNRPDGPSAPGLMNEIRRKVVDDGAAFEEMARIHSDGSQKSEGGDWGWIERGVLQPNLAAIAFSLKPGEVSQPIATPESVFLMLVEGASPAHTKPLSEMREQIEATLRADKQRQELKTWIDRLKAKSYIRYNPA